MGLADIYGIDECDFAESIATDALGAPSPCLKSGSEAAKGNRPYDEGDVVSKNMGGGNDSRATTKGNHGGQG